MMYCSKPFEEFEIDVDGNCYCCCRWWNNAYCLGNIFTQTPEEIWNGDAAQELRKSILNGDYKYCNTDICLKSFADDLNYQLITDYPREISLCYDYTCTARCVFCNDNVQKMPKCESEKWNELIFSKFIPLLKNARFVRLSMVGELFISEHSQNLVKQIVKEYPNIKFEIVSNGIFASQKNIEKLGIEDRIESIKFSVPSMTAKNYKKLVRNGNLKNVMENLTYISELKKDNKINDFRLNFIISSVNFKEFPKYLKKAQKLGAEVDCILLDKKDASTEFLRNFDLYNVASPEHPDYNRFIDIINSLEVKRYKNVHINPEIKKLKKVLLYKKFLNTVKFLLKKIQMYYNKQ